MNTSPRQRSRQPYYSVRQQARLDGETHGKLEELVNTFRRKRSALLRLKIYVVLAIAALLIGSMLSSCATGWQTTPTAPACVFVERCRNPALTTPGG
jgi:hypothetical protein